MDVSIVVLPIAATVIAFILIRRAMNTSPDGPRNWLSKRETLLLAAMTFAIAIVQTVSFLDEGEATDVALLVLWYGSTGLLVVRALGTP